MNSLEKYEEIIAEYGSLQAYHDAMGLQRAMENPMTEPKRSNCNNAFQEGQQIFMQPYLAAIPKYEIEVDDWEVGKIIKVEPFGIIVRWFDRQQRKLVELDHSIQEFCDFRLINNQIWLPPSVFPPAITPK